VPPPSSRNNPEYPPVTRLAINVVMWPRHTTSARLADVIPLTVDWFGGRFDINEVIMARARTSPTAVFIHMVRFLYSVIHLYTMIGSMNVRGVGVMRSVFPVVVMAVLVAVAALVAATLRGPSEGVNATSPPPPPVRTLRGFIVAVVVDYANGPRTEFFLDFGNGTHVPLDLSNAIIRLKDHFVVYVGNPQRPVYVTGMWQGRMFKAWEVYE